MYIHVLAINENWSPLNELVTKMGQLKQSHNTGMYEKKEKKKSKATIKSR